MSDSCPPHHVAYMRYVGPYGPHGIPELWSRLRTWMETRELPLETTVRLGVAYDDPRITAAEQCRYDACVVIPPDFPPDRWVNVMDIPAGRYAVWEFTGTPARSATPGIASSARGFRRAGTSPTTGPASRCIGGARTADARPGTFRCDLCLPVRPL